VVAAGIADVDVTDDVAVTTVGAQAVYDRGLAAADVDPLVGERLRWTLADGARLLADARFTLDPSPGADAWEQSRVRTLGVELAGGPWTVRLGRHAVAYGGPRIVDGAQLLHRDGALAVGAWGGLAPDPFTTRPALRGGGGPIIAYEQPLLQASAVGEVLATAAGVDRVGLLLQARVAPGSGADLTGRLDAQLGPAGAVGLADGTVSARWAPVRSVRLDALYDAYSSLRYLQTAALDPDVRRFANRLEALGLAPGISAELPDPSLYHLFGTGAAWQPAVAVAPRAAIVTRYRHHGRLEDRYAYVDPQLGVVGVAGGRLDATVDLAWTWHGAAGSREDLGLNLVLDPLSSGRAALDGSARLVVDPAYGGRPGWYADLFVDVLATDDAAVVAGVAATQEPVGVPDLGLAGFVWIQHRLDRAPRRGQPAGTTRLP
jgi:hypothetical protein